jgi:hypothetical protein
VIVVLSENHFVLHFFGAGLHICCKTGYFSPPNVSEELIVKLAFSLVTEYVW